MFGESAGNGKAPDTGGQWGSVGGSANEPGFGLSFADRGQKSLGLWFSPRDRVAGRWPEEAGQGEAAPRSPGPVTAQTRESSFELPPAQPALVPSTTETWSEKWGRLWAPCNLRVPRRPWGPGRWFLGFG